MEKLATIESLAQDFELPVERVIELAEKAGVAFEDAGRELSQEEVDRIYDAVLLSEMPPSKFENDPPPAGRTRERMLLIDTSSLLHRGAPAFLKGIVPELLREGRKLIVPDAVMKELSAKALQQDNPELSGKAREIMRLVLEYRDMGAVAVHGDTSDGTFADNVFHTAAAKFGLKYDLTVITQDYRLGQDLLLMGHMRSVHHRRISVSKLNSSGELVPVKWEGVNN